MYPGVSTRILGNKTHAGRGWRLEIVKSAHGVVLEDAPPVGVPRPGHALRAPRPAGGTAGPGRRLVAGVVPELACVYSSHMARSGPGPDRAVVLLV